MKCREQETEGRNRLCGGCKEETRRAQLFRLALVPDYFRTWPAAETH